MAFISVTFLSRIRHNFYECKIVKHVQRSNLSRFRDGIVIDELKMRKTKMW